MNCRVIWLLFASIGINVHLLDALNTFEWTSDGQWHKASTGLNVNPYLSSRSTCIDLPSNLSLCHGIGYNKMRLPNLLQHETLQEVMYYKMFAALFFAFLSFFFCFLSFHLSE